MTECAESCMENNASCFIRLKLQPGLLFTSESTNYQGLKAYLAKKKKQRICFCLWGMSTHQPLQLKILI